LTRGAKSGGVCTTWTRNEFGKTLLDFFHVFGLEACHNLSGAGRGVSSAFDDGLELFKGPGASAVHWTTLGGIQLK